MEDHKPGRGMDAAVHRALWPKQEIRKLWSKDDHLPAAFYGPGDDEWTPPPGVTWGWYFHEFGSGALRGDWHVLPAYSTELTAWDGIGNDRGWYWVVNERWHKLEVALVKIYNAAKDAELAGAEVWWEDEPNRFRAQARARAECVRQWAERRAEQ